MSMAAAAAAIDYVGLLTDTCTIRGDVGTGVKDEFSGKEIVVWGDVATLVECRFDAVIPRGGGAAYEIKIGKEIVKADYLVFFEVDEDITEKDRVTTLVRGGVTLISDEVGVLLVQVPAGFDHHKEVYLQLTRT